MIETKLPDFDYSLVIRTDFSNDALWQAICEQLKQPQAPYGFAANVECINDTSCDGLTPTAVPSILPEESDRAFVFLVDAIAVANAEHPILVVDVSEQPGRFFRVVPSQAWAVENNLRLANMDFEDFAAACGPDGVMRGYPA